MKYFVIIKEIMNKIRIKFPFTSRNKKFKELVLYIADKSKDDPFFGATKLNKILFLVDFKCYAWQGKSFTGAKYVHLQNGPAPNEILGIVESLQHEKRAKIKEIACHGYTQKRLVPLMGADTSIFTEEELLLIDATIEQTKNTNATEISDWSHTLMPWRLTKNGEEIPYCTAYMLQNHPIGREGLSWAKQEIKKIKKETGHAT